VTRRFFSAELGPETRELSLSGAEGRHLAVVLRAEPGDSVILFNGRGVEADGRVRSVTPQGVLLELSGHRQSTGDSRRRVTLATAVPKGDRFDWLVEKGVELGLHRIVPLVTARSIVEPRDTRLEKLRRVIVEASKQCGRNELLELAPLTPWKQFLSGSFPSGSLWIAHPGGAECHAVCHSWPAEVTLLVGPEGGWTDHELVEVKQTGGAAVSLGPLLLRIETAGLALAALACAQLPR